MPNLLSYNTYSGKIIFVYLSPVLLALLEAKRFLVCVISLCKQISL